jgi:hypothetical protein
MKTEGSHMMRSRTSRPEHRTESTPTTASSGRTLEPGLKSIAEQRFGHNFDSVRVHADSEAAAMAGSLEAAAFTRGPDIYFAEEAADFGSPDGAQRLMHELAHVVQYDRAPEWEASDSLTTTAPDEAAEGEAREAASIVMTGGSPQLSAAPSAGIARDDDERGFNAHLLPPSLSYGYGAGGGSGNLSLGLGGLGAEYKRGMFHTEANVGLGGGLGLNLGMGAPLNPWMMDVNRDLTGAAGGMNKLMNGGGLDMSALSGFGALGDVYGAGEPSKYNWGAGLQLSHDSEETRAMLGLRYNF